MTGPAARGPVMTDPSASRPRQPTRAKKQRVPKAALRVWAWIAGVLAFFAPWSALNASPSPDSTAAAHRVRQVRPLIIRKITRRVIVVTTVPHVIHIGATYSGSGGTSGGTTSGSSGGTSATTTTSGGGGGAPPPPPPPPPVSTGGS